jgi:hypothetical protein
MTESPVATLAGFPTSALGPNQASAARAGRLRWPLLYISMESSSACGATEALFAAEGATNLHDRRECNAGAVWSRLAASTSGSQEVRRRFSGTARFRSTGMARIRCPI